MKLILLALLVSFSARAANYFFISGDGDYVGPNYSGAVTSEDQARALYEKALAEAQRSPETPTVIFYDPLGRGLFSRKKMARLDVVTAGQRKTFYKSEIDSTGPEALRWIEARLAPFSTELTAAEGFLYYYGEHVPAVLSTTSPRYDRSSPQGRMSYQQLVAIAESARKFSAASEVILHTCNNADLRLREQLFAVGIRRVTGSTRVIPNQSGEITSLFQVASSKDRIDAFMRANNSSAYPFHWESTTAEEHQGFLAKLRKILGQELSAVHKSLEEFKRRARAQAPAEEIGEISEHEFYLYPGETIIALSDLLTNTAQKLPAQQLRELSSLMQEEEGLIQKSQVNLSAQGTSGL